MSKNTYLLSVVLPVYNEYENIEIFIKTLISELDKLTVPSEIIFVDDGSSDNSLDKIKDVISYYPSYSFTVIQFSKNFGHQMALFAGLMNATGDFIIMMDTDLQHPPYLIHELLKYGLEGYDVVYTVRDDTDKLNFIKKVTSKYFYKIFNFITGFSLKNSADFRLITKQALDVIKSLDERDIFLRGMFSWIGFSQKAVHFLPQERKYGHTKYNLKKMLSFALSGITSFSIKPIRLSLIMCAFSVSIALGYSVYALYIKFVLKAAIQGWTSILILNSLFFAGVFIMLGIVGEYVGKIHMEAKKRPRYIVRQVITKNSNK